MKKIFLLIVLVLIAPLWIGSNSEAQQPPISVSVAATGTVFQPEVPIPINITLKNSSGGALTVPRDFLDRAFHLLLTFTDPAGNTILADEAYTSTSGTPGPPPVIPVGDELVQVEPVVLLPSDWVKVIQIPNARTFYSLACGGDYQIRLSLPLKTYTWVGSGTRPASDFVGLDDPSFSQQIYELASNAAQFTLNAPADLVLDKNGPATAIQGSNLTYTITVTNNGPSMACGVTVTDALPAGLSLISATSSQGKCKGTTEINCQLGQIASGAGVTVTLVAKGTATGTSITNTATVSGTQADPNLTNNSDTLITSLTAGQPQMTGTVTAKGWHNLDGRILYVDLKLTNTGTGPAQNVRINSISLRTLSGTGVVTNYTSLSPALPLLVGNLAANTSAVTRFYFYVPPTVTRYSITESGNLQNTNGTNYNFSLGQAVIP